MPGIRNFIRMIHESTTLEIMESGENSFYDGAPVYNVYRRHCLWAEFAPRHCETTRREQDHTGRSVWNGLFYIVRVGKQRTGREQGDGVYRQDAVSK